MLYALYEYLGQENLKCSILNDGRIGYKLENIFHYLKQSDKFRWINSTSSLGKKIKQWYDFDKKREFDGKRKCTIYIFNEELIIKKLQEENIDISDFE